MATLRSAKGFTLIEILIATAILGIALIAVLKSASDTVRDQTYLQEKTLGHFVGQNVLTQVRVGLIKAPISGAIVSQSVNNFGRNWTWQLSSIAMLSQPILVLTVKVTDSEGKIVDVSNAYQVKGT
jgi:type II secretion system protein I